MPEGGENFDSVGHDSGLSSSAWIGCSLNVVPVTYDYLHVSEGKEMWFCPVSAVTKGRYRLLRQWPKGAVSDEVRWQQLMMESSGANGVIG